MRRGTVPLRHDDLRASGKRTRGRVDDVNDGIGADLDAKAADLLFEEDSVGLLLCAGDGVIRYPLGRQGNRKGGEEQEQRWAEHH
jgi:hypothetical protein